MVATILWYVWGLLALAIGFGPILCLGTYWEKADKRQLLLEIQHRVTIPVPRFRKLKRWIIGLTVFGVSGLFYAVMMEAQHGVYAALNRASPF